MIQIDNKWVIQDIDFDSMLYSQVDGHIDRYMKNYFNIIFNRYLEENYGIDEEQLKRILKNIAPEEFI